MQLFPLVLNFTGLAPVFGAFALVNTCGALAVYHMVPETCGRSLEEVELQLWQDTKRNVIFMAFCKPLKQLLKLLFWDEDVWGSLGRSNRMSNWDLWNMIRKTLKVTVCTHTVLYP